MSAHSGLIPRNLTLAARLLAIARRAVHTGQALLLRAKSGDCIQTRKFFTQAVVLSLNLGLQQFTRLQIVEEIC